MHFLQGSTQCVIPSGAHSVLFPPCSTRCAVSPVQHTVCDFHRRQQHSLQQRSWLLPFSQVSSVRYFYAIPSNMAHPHILHWSPSLGTSFRMVHILFWPRMLSVSWFAAPAREQHNSKQKFTFFIHWQIPDMHNCT